LALLSHCIALRAFHRRGDRAEVVRVLSAHHRFERVSVLEQDVRERFAGRFGAGFDHQMFGEQAAEFGRVSWPSQQLFHGLHADGAVFAEQARGDGIRAALHQACNGWVFELLDADDTARRITAVHAIDETVGREGLWI